MTTTKSPSNATLNLFDYWILEDYSDVRPDPSGWQNMGINEGHELRFSNAGEHEGPESGSINAWTGRSGSPYFGMVETTLGEDGYPVLAAGNRYAPGAVTSGQSLAYLFDSSDVEGKEEHRNVRGLVQLIDGYYTYDSAKNFASYNEETGNFTLYNNHAVNNDAGNVAGQFFPFNSGSDVFDLDSQGLIAPKNMKSTDAKLNHYFGAELTADFKQPENGMIGDQAMTFDFAGDDDVWVFVDGVLVGDLGGVHGAASLSIDFQTGTVTMADSRPVKPANSWGSKTTTIRDCFEDALGEDAAAAYLKAGTDTFKDNSYHTLKFYYLERGNTDSNMKLTFNLQQTTESGIEKDNQRGEPIPDVGFELYLATKEADGTYAVSDWYPDPISTGTTDDNGKLVFKTPDGTRPLDFAEMYGKGCEYYILREVKTPDGYHASDDAWLRYAPSNGRDGDGFLVTENLWQTGTYMAPAQVTTFNQANHNGEVATSSLHGQTEQWIKVDESKTMFAVLYKRDPATPSPGATWYPIVGSEGNWSVDEDALTTADHFNELYRNGDAKPFLLQNDAWSVDLGVLPGRVTEYPFMASDLTTASFRVVYYLVDMPREQLEEQLKAGGSPITDDNIYMLESDGLKGNFTRTSYAKMRVTNVENKLVVQKVDDEGAPVNGAVFDLYRAADMNDAATAPLESAVPYRTETTAGMTHESPAWSDGSAAFKALPQGTYYLVERSAPAGYVKNDRPVRVIVDGTGVYAGAGVADDGITVEAGVGTLIDSMDDFGRNDQVEVTLHDIKAQRATAAVSALGQKNSYAIDGWTEAEGSDLENQVHLRYNDDAAADGSESMAYVADRDKQNSDVTTFSTDVGMIRATVRQDSLTEAMEHRHGIGTWYDLGDQVLNNLYSGSTTVRVENQRTSSLEVEKKIDVPAGYTAPDGADELDFAMRYTFTDASGAPLAGAFTARVFKTADGGEEVQQGDDFTIASGDVHAIKNGETLKVYGLPEGTNYRVNEQTDSMPSGFAQMRPSDDAGNARDATGTIAAAGEAPAHRVFVNRYTPAPAQIHVDTLGVQKNFTADADLGDPWGLLADGEGFAFVLQGSTDTEPMPDDAVQGASGHLESTLSVTAADKDASFSKFFQSVAFDTPGVYAYEVFERTPTGEDRVPGVAYSDAAYEVTATVTENTAERRLEASVSVTRIYDDAGAAVNEPVDPQVDGSFVLPFNNSAHRQQATVSALATKVLTGRDIVTGEFGFRMDAVPLDDEQASAFPMPEGAQTDPATGRPYVTTSNSGTQVSFGQICFTDADYGESIDYYYELSEIVPDDAVNVQGVAWADASADERAAGGFSKEGVTYSDQRYIMWVHLEYGDSDQGVMTAAVTYYRGGWPEAGQSGLGGAGHEEFVPSDHGVNGVLFENEYRSSFHTNLIQVTKRLIGRDMTVSDGFEIAAEGADDASAALLKTALKDSDGTMEGSTLVFRPGEAANGAMKKMSAGSLTLTQDDAGTAQNPKVYTWRISERIPDDAAKAPGVTYDRKVLRLEFSVVDDQKGSIKVTPTLTREYDTDGTPDGSKVNLDIVFDRETGRYSLDFTNVFEAKETYAGIDVSKTMHGRAMNDGEFRFVSAATDYRSAIKLLELYAVSPEQYAAEQSFSAPAADEGAAAHMRKLQGLVFTQDDVGAGDTWYSYFYIEQLPRDDDAATDGTQWRGVTYDPRLYQVDISPRLDEATGALYTITEVYEMQRGDSTPDTPIAVYDSRDGSVPRIAFENSYKAAPVDVDANMLTKKLEGRDWREGDSFAFAFEQYRYQGADGEKAPGDEGYVGVAIPDAAVTADTEDGFTDGVKRFGFSGVTFSEPGTYRYTVTEKAGDAEGIEYSRETADIAVNVVDLGRGGLVAFVTASPAPDGHDAHFTNVYHAKDTSVSTDGLFSKTLEGRDWTDADAFSFEMRAIDPADAPLPDGATDGVARTEVRAADAADGTAAFGFGSIVYTLDDLQGVPTAEDGTRSRDFVYEVRETVPDDAVNAQGVAWAQATDEQRAAGGFAKSGLIYDSHPARLTVTVADDGKGSLSASAKMAATMAASDASFTNTYRSELRYDAAQALGLAKTLTGRAMADGQFGFTIEAADAASARVLGIDEATLVREVSAPGASDGQAAHVSLLPAEGVTFTQADAGATYRYTVRETRGGGAGYTNDETAYTVDIAVADAGDGTLAATTTATGSNGFAAQSVCTAADAAPAQAIELPFANAYAADGSLAVAASKTLAGRDLRAGEFSFALEALPASGAAHEPLLLDTAENAADGSVAFDATPLSIDALKRLAADGYAVSSAGDAGAAWSLRLRVSEDASALPGGVSAQTGSVELAATVSDAGDGTLDVEVSEPQGGVVLRNVYSAGTPVAMTPAGSKLLVHADGLAPDSIAGSFSFALTAETAGAPMPAGDGAQATNDEAGNVVFGTIEFSEDLLRDVPAAADGSRSKTFSYRVTETGRVPGVTNDPLAQTGKEFSYTLVDDGQGHLGVTCDQGSGPQFSFANTYEVAPVQVALSARKALSGKPLEAGAFEFALTSRGDDASVVTAANAADGSVSFDALTFAVPGVYRYTLAEVPGDAAGVAYDDAVYAVEVRVADTGAGALAAEVSVRDADGALVEGGVPVFSNAYEPAGTSVVLTAEKTLSGRDLAAGEFAFDLVDKAGAVLQTARNDAEGRVAFAPLAYDAADLADAAWEGPAGAQMRSKAFSYTVREQVPDSAVNAEGVTWAQATDEQRAAGGFALDGVVYDASAFTAWVVVSDDGQGRLAVTEVSWDAAPSFRNEVEEPVDPGDPDVPVGPDEPDGPAEPGDSDAPSDSAAPGDPETPGSEHGVSDDEASRSGSIPATGDAASGAAAGALAGAATAAAGVAVAAVAVRRARLREGRR